MSSSTDWKNFDPMKPIRKLICFLKLVGIWPLDIKNRFLYFCYIIYGILFQCTFSYAYAAFGTTIDGTNVKMMTEQIFNGLAEIAMCLRMTNFVYYFKDATHFLITIKSFELRNQEECELYKKRLSSFSTVRNILITATTFALTFSNAAPHFSSELRLPYPGWYPLDWSNFCVKYSHCLSIITEIVGNNRTSYWIVYFYQLIGGVFLAETLVVLQIYQIFCIICATSQVEILAMRVEKIGYNNLIEDKKMINQRKESIYETQLLECVKYHEILMR